MQGWTPGRRVRRRLYGARDRARKRGDRSFDSLSVIFCGPVDGFGPTEVRIVRRDCLPKKDDPEDDGFAAYPSLMTVDELPLTIRARGPNRPHIPRHSLGPDPFGCVGEVSCKIIKRFLMGEFDDVAERLAAADAAAPDPDPRDAREMTLEEASAFLERLASARGRNARSSL